MEDNGQGCLSKKTMSLQMAYPRKWFHCPAGHENWYRQGAAMVSFIPFLNGSFHCCCLDPTQPCCCDDNDFLTAQMMSICNRTNGESCTKSRAARFELSTWTEDIFGLPALGMLGGGSMLGKKSMQKYLIGKKESPYQRMLIFSNFYFLPSWIIELLRFSPIAWIPSQKFPFSRLP